MKTKLMMSAVLSLLSLSAFAASSGSLDIKGVVGTINELTVETDLAAESINIVAGESGLKVATISEKCNNLNGYDIMMSSANAGRLVNQNNPDISTTYVVNYNGVDVGQPSTTAFPVKTVNSLGELTIVQSDVTLNVNAKPTAAAGNYTDTITFSIVAK